MLILLISLLASVSMAAADVSTCRELVATPIGDTAEQTQVFFARAEQAYRDCRKDVLPVDVRAKALLNYGQSSAIRNNVQAAVAAYKEAIDLLSRGKSDFSLLLLTALDRASYAESTLGLRGDAVAHANRALAIRTSRYGADSAEAVSGMVHLAMVHTTFENYAAAEALLNSALNAARKGCGDHCRPLAEAYAGFSAFHGAKGDEEAARKYEELGLSATPPTRRGHKE
jgi:tetratricopeptide (TPR) repeat protein